MVGGLNHMIDDVKNGKTVFYEFYSEEEKKEQRTKSTRACSSFVETQERPLRSYRQVEAFLVGSVHEGFPYAMAISKHGYNAFVLRYRAGSGGAVATSDLAAAISYVFRKRKSAWRWYPRLFLVG